MKGDLHVINAEGHMESPTLLVDIYATNVDNFLNFFVHIATKLSSVNHIFSNTVLKSMEYIFKKYTCIKCKIFK